VYIYTYLYILIDRQTTRIIDNTIIVPLSAKNNIIDAPRNAYIYTYNNKFSTVQAIIYYIFGTSPLRSSPVQRSFGEKEKNARWRRKIIISFLKYFHLHFIINSLLLTTQHIAKVRSFTEYTPTDPACTFHADSINSTTKRHNRITPGALSYIYPLARTPTLPDTHTHTHA